MKVDIKLKNGHRTSFNNAYEVNHSGNDVSIVDYNHMIISRIKKEDLERIKITV